MRRPRAAAAGQRAALHREPQCTKLCEAVRPAACEAKGRLLRCGRVAVRRGAATRRLRGARELLPKIPGEDLTRALCRARAARVGPLLDSGIEEREAFGEELQVSPAREGLVLMHGAFTIWDFIATHRTDGSSAIAQLVERAAVS